MAWKRSSVRLRYSPQKPIFEIGFFVMHYFVYILFSEKCNKYYVGQTENLERRIVEHNIGKGGSFSSTCFPWKLVYHESVASRPDAVKREQEIKGKKSRKYIEYLVNTK